MDYVEITEDNVLEISELYVEAFNGEPWSDKWTLDTASSRLLEILNSEDSYGLAAYDNKKLVGMILGRKETYYDAVMFEIKEFCVDRNIKGKGIGSKIIDEFTKQLKFRGVNRIILLTTKGESTEGFYKKHNFNTFKNMIVMGKDIQ